MQTNKRQLRLTISAIFESHGIDDLALEGKIVDAVTMFFEQTSKGIDPVKIRGNVLDGMLKYLDDHRRYEQMIERVEKSLRVRPDGGNKWNDVIKYLMKQDERGQSIEKYAEWCKQDPFNSPKIHQIALHPAIIRATWAGAFAPTAKEIKQSFDPFAALSQYVSTGD